MSFRILPRGAISSVRAAARPVLRPKFLWTAGTLATVAVVLSIDHGTVDVPLWSDIRGARLVKADAAKRPDDVSSKVGGFRVDPETDVRFPISLSTVTASAPLHLVGLGVRKVSFLRVKVYSAGFYIEEDQVQGKKLHDVPGWHTYTAKHLLTLPTKSDAPLDAPQMTGEALMKSLLERPVACAVRIVPIRNTDFSHLRDGFTRALAARQKLARQAGNLSESDDERISTSIQSLKGFFPAQKVPKGDSLLLLRTKQGSLAIEYQGRVLGEVRDPWVAREMMLAYFADKDVISPSLKEDVARGFEQLIKSS